jgi:hypothetical protein
MLCNVKKKSENMLKVIFKEKDSMAIKKEMEEVGIRPQLWLWQLTNGLYMKLKPPMCC